MARRKAKHEDVKPDPRNANKGTARGAAFIEHSLEQYGAGRSILVDKHGTAIAGNKTLEAAVAKGIPLEIVKTDGKSLVVVQREDLDLDDERARKLAYADNRATELDLDWEAQQILDDIDAGVDLSDIFDENEVGDILAELEEKPVKTISTDKPPEMTWVLVGIPTAKYGQVAQAVEKLSAIPETIVEVGVANAEDEEDG